MIEELDRICCNCSNFFTDVNDLDGKFGVCIKDEAFEEYFDEIFENGDFSVCIDLYKEKRFDEISCRGYWTTGSLAPKWSVI
jgi:hypothetical protein